MTRVTWSHRLLAMVPAAWLLPNHYYPWPSAWQDGLALALVGAAALLGRSRATLPGVWTVLLAVLAASVLGQWASGKLGFAGDGLVVGLYLTATVFALALGRGAVTAGQCPTRPQPALDLLAFTTLASAAASVGVALVQWAGIDTLGIYVLDLPPGWRPYGNVGQANHLGTIAFLGLCALGWLFEARRIGALAALVTASYLLVGLVASGSRTGWLQLTAAAVLALALRRRAMPRLTRTALVGVLALFALLVVAWPVANDAWLLAGSRSMSDQMQPGVRLPLWWALLDAIGREPWSGYGWQQVVLAQQAVALDHPPILRHFEHSHNLLLDLALWIGLPLAALCTALAGAGLWQLIRGHQDARATWLLAAVAGLLVHGLLELPLQYAYFLVPLGVALGAAHGLGAATGVLTWPRGVLQSSALVYLGVLGLVAADYLVAEQNHRLLRLESARIGTARIETPAPQLRLLDQLQAFLEFTRTEARPGMPAEQVAWMRRVSQRFAYPPAMFRYASAAAMNGDLASAQQTLARLCAMHPPKRCDEAREAWTPLQQRYPALQAVRVPETPAQR